MQEINRWVGECELRYGRPRHPQSQGLVEQGNGSITSMLASMKASSNTPSSFSWSWALPQVMYNLNTDHHTNLKTTPFDVIFGQPPNNGDKKKLQI